MAERLPFRYLNGESKDCHPLQHRSIIAHHLRVDGIFTTLVQAEVSLVSRPPDGIVSLTHQAVLQHDLAKLDVPYYIHKATRYRPAAEYYAPVYYNDHPAKTVMRQGAEALINQNPFVAHLIYHHHPELRQPPIKGLSYQRLNSPSFNWALTYLIVADGIAAANETHRFYNHDGAASQKLTISIFEQKLTNAGLAGIVDIPAAVAIGYHAFRQLNF